MAKDAKGHGSNSNGGGPPDDAGMANWWKKGAEAYEAQKKGKEPLPDKKAAKPKAKAKDDDPAPSKAINKRGDTFKPKR